ncbi:subtilisin-like protease SBT1.8 [Canna indica]|uniref:Subtilisin-like protease SBT1.8 n=1 Tax=Canna indica TaxID=4628 RepID=A0AAQ3KKZ3_9LILI|nr:subtilisin-like protease SBT1.8 [Canna indica]
MSRLPIEVALQGKDGSLESRLIYSYHSVMTGFSAVLTEAEVKHLSEFDWFLHAYPSPIYHTMTTHTPRFLHLRSHTQSVWNSTNMGAGVIIGVLDTGVTPRHPSFDDRDMSPPPTKWKGRCNLKGYCNKKLIGARSFINYDRVKR